MGFDDGAQLDAVAFSTVHTQHNVIAPAITGYVKAPGLDEHNCVNHCLDESAAHHKQITPVHARLSDEGWARCGLSGSALNGPGKVEHSLKA